MKLSKVKRICVAAGQLCVIPTEEPVNMAQQWVGTEEAMYPMYDVAVSRRALQSLWELSTATVQAMDEDPVMHDVQVLDATPGQIDTAGKTDKAIVKIGGYVAIEHGEGLVLINEELLAPCGLNRSFVVEQRRDGVWVAVYVGGMLDAMIRPASGAICSMCEEIVDELGRRLRHG